jgi:hypothetical protein
MVRRRCIDDDGLLRSAPTTPAARAGGTPTSCPSTRPPTSTSPSGPTLALAHRPGSPPAATATAAASSPTATSYHRRPLRPWQQQRRPYTASALANPRRDPSSSPLSFSPPQVQLSMRRTYATLLTPGIPSMSIRMTPFANPTPPTQRGSPPTWTFTSLSGFTTTASCPTPALPLSTPSTGLRYPHWHLSLVPTSITHTPASTAPQAPLARRAAGAHVLDGTSSRPRPRPGVRFLDAATTTGTSPRP